MENLFALM